MDKNNVYSPDFEKQQQAFAGPKIFREFKLVIIGGGGVGKSCLTLRFVQGDFPEEYDPTIEDSYRSQCMVDNEYVLFDILDTAGQEEYAAMRETYMHSGEGFLIVFSITSRQSFEEVADYLRAIHRIKDRQTFPLLIVGNKSDLKAERDVSTQEAEEFAKTLGYTYIETSAKDAKQDEIEKLFFDVFRKVKEHEKPMETKREDYNSASRVGGEENQKSCCMMCTIM